MTTSISDQSLKKRQQIFLKSLKLLDSSSGIMIQRIPASQLWSYLKEFIKAKEDAVNLVPLDYKPPSDDPVVDVLFRFDDIFAECMNKKVDIFGSCVAVAEEGKKNGAKEHGALFLAWKPFYDRGQKIELVGAMTVHKFRFTQNFSTDANSLSARDYDILNGERSIGNKERRAYHLRNTLYIDSLCSKSFKGSKIGAGKLLVLHAIGYALRRKCTGVLALSYSMYANRIPQSYDIFDSLQFEEIIPKATFRVVNMYGTWFFKSLSDGFTDFPDEWKVCVRRGMTSATQDKLIWRC